MATLSDVEKKRADELISNLELLTGELMARQPKLASVTEPMRDNLRALRSLLDVVRSH